MVAASLEEAEKLALQEAGNHDFPGEKSAEYTIEGDGYKRATVAATALFLNGSPDERLASFQQLLAESEVDGTRSVQQAAVDCSELVRDLMIDTLIGMIERLRNEIMSVY